MEGGFCLLDVGGLSCGFFMWISVGHIVGEKCRNLKCEYDTHGKAPKGYSVGLLVEVAYLGVINGSCV